MTQAAETPQTSHVTVAATLTYSYSFTAVAADVKVYLDNVLQGGVTVDDVAKTITLAADPGNGASLVIRRETALDQQSSFTTGGAFPAQTNESTLDRIIRQIQDVFLRVTDQETVGDELDAHVAASNPHPDSASDADVSAVQADVDANQLVTDAHIADANPHTNSAGISDNEAITGQWNFTDLLEMDAGGLITGTDPLEFNMGLGTIQTMLFSSTVVDTIFRLASATGNLDLRFQTSQASQEIVFEPNDTIVMTLTDTGITFAVPLGAIDVSSVNASGNLNLDGSGNQAIDKAAPGNLNIYNRDASGNINLFSQNETGDPTVQVQSHLRCRRGIEFGDGTNLQNDTTLQRQSAGVLEVEGKRILDEDDIVPLAKLFGYASDLITISPTGSGWNLVTNFDDSQKSIGSGLAWKAGDDEIAVTVAGTNTYRVAVTLDINVTGATAEGAVTLSFGLGIDGANPVLDEQITGIVIPVIDNSLGNEVAAPTRQCVSFETYIDLTSGEDLGLYYQFLSDGGSGASVSASRRRFICELAG